MQYLITLNDKELNAIKNIDICNCTRTTYNNKKIHNNCNEIIYNDLLNIDNSNILKNFIILRIESNYNNSTSIIQDCLNVIISILLKILIIISFISNMNTNRFLSIFIFLILIGYYLYLLIYKLFFYKPYMNLLQFLEQSDVLTNKHKIEICLYVNNIYIKSGNKGL